MSISSVFFTNKGRTLQAKAQTGTPLHFTRLAIGDGDLRGQAPQTLNALINEKLSIDITKLVTGEDGSAKIGGYFNNSNIATGFYYRELGLFARDPDDANKEILYCYGNGGAMAEYIPTQDSELIEKRIDIIAIIGNATNVSATINSSLVGISPEDLEVHNRSESAHPNIVMLVQNEAEARQNADNEIAKQIQNLKSPYIMPEGTDLPASQRTSGKMYFKVTSRQPGGGVASEVKVSPNMGIKITDR